MAIEKVDQSGAPNLEEMTPVASTRGPQNRGAPAEGEKKRRREGAPEAGLSAGHKDGEHPENGENSETNEHHENSENGEKVNENENENENDRPRHRVDRLA